MARGLVFAAFLVMMVMLSFPEGTSAWMSVRRSRRISRVPATLFYIGDCHSSNDRGCAWYRSCLEKEVPCSGKDGDYAIADGEKFCNKYTFSYSSFSSNGQKWVDAVRKCLQVKVAPELSQFPKSSCADLKALAFESHVPCYLNPGNDAPSFCSLPWDDKLEILSTIKSSFGSDFIDTLLTGCQ